ncbi:MAG: homoserine dehydrogenase [Bacillaceae bacterium]
MDNVVNIGILGLGTVGTGVLKILRQNASKITRDTGCHVDVKKALVKNLTKSRNIDVKEGFLTDNPDDILNDDSIHIIIEVMGGIEHTKDYIVQALKNGKHVITANKDLMALYGAELLTIAQENGCDLYYEASVAGGIPILRGLVDGLASDRITKMMGIVNGTTNFMLTKMIQNNWDYETALTEAQRLGFAESDPTADVDGLDAARKIVILGTLGFSLKLSLDDVYIKGIRDITKRDLELSQQLGLTMKLIGKAEEQDGAVSLSVVPTLLPNTHPLTGVHNEYNAIYVYGTAIGETMFYGPGAGSLPTATAVVSDLVAVLKHVRLDTTGKHMAIATQQGEKQSDNNIFSKYYIRLFMQDEPGMFLKLTKAFADYDISFEKILQLPVNHNTAEVVIVTHKTSKAHFESALSVLEGIVKEIASYYDVEGK